jgi:hypothetical protein
MNRLLIVYSIVLLNLTCIGQNYDRDLYTSVDVFYKTYWTRKNTLTNEVFPMTDSFSLSRKTPSGLHTILVDSTVIPDDTKKLSFVGFFINNTPDTIIVYRNDNAIHEVETQILINEKWLSFQLTANSDCGESYFKSKLPPYSYYIIYIPDPSAGHIKTKLRLKIPFQNGFLYSNEVDVMLTPERIAKTKIKIKPIDW